MAKRASNQTVGEAVKGRQFTDFKDMILQLKPDASTGVTVKTVRLIGVPIMFTEFNQRKRDPNDPKKSITVPYPDAELNKSFTRVGHDDPDQCPWRKLGYSPRTMFAVNVIERGGKNGPDTVKVLCKGSSFFKFITELEKGQRELNEENGNDDLCVCLGAARGQELRIKAELDSSVLGGVKYSFTPVPGIKPLSEEDIELLRRAGEPKPEDVATLREEYEADAATDATLPPYEPWFEFGHPVRRLYKFTPIRVAETEQATQADLDFDTEDDEDAAVEAPATTLRAPSPPPNGKSSKAPKAEAPAANLSNPFADDSDDDEPAF